MRTTIAAAVLLSACGPMPEDRLYLYGRAIDATGTVLTGAPVTLHQGCQYPDVTGEVLLEQETGAQGRFFFDVAFAEARDLCVRLGGGPGGAQMIASGAGELRYLYRPDQLVPEFTSTDGGLELTSPRGPWTTQDPETGARDDVGAYQWDLRSAGGVVWRAERRDVPLRLDARLREDFGPLTARVIHHALYSVRSPWLFADPRGSIQSQVIRGQGPSAEVPEGTGIVSAIRDAPCRVGGHTFEPCPLTDGSLRPPPDEFLDVVAAAPGERVEFALARAVQPTSVVLRDVPAVQTMILEVSNDGVTWTAHQSLSVWPRPVQPSPYQELMNERHFRRITLAPLPEPVRFLSLRISEEPYAPVRQFSASEVSFFE